MSTQSSLTIHFADTIAVVKGQDLLLKQAIIRHFSHCLIESNSDVVTVTYHIIQSSCHQFQLFREELLLYGGSSQSFILERLFHDVTMMLAAECREHLVFHAAGLTYRNAGVILCGESGSGKSTLAAKLITSGFDYLTDELVAISLDESYMSGLARSLALKQGSLSTWQRWLSNSEHYSFTQLPSGTVLLDPTQLRSNCVATASRPEILLFVRYIAGATFTIQCLTKAKAAFQLMHSLINAKVLSNRALPAITKLAQQIPAYSLVYADSDQMVSWLRKTIRDRI